MTSHCKMHLLPLNYCTANQQLHFHFTAAAAAVACVFVCFESRQLQWNDSHSNRLFIFFVLFLLCIYAYTFRLNVWILPPCGLLRSNDSKWLVDVIWNKNKYLIASAFFLFFLSFIPTGCRLWRGLLFTQSVDYRYNRRVIYCDIIH